MESQHSIDVVIFPVHHGQPGLELSTADQGRRLFIQVRAGIPLRTTFPELLAFNDLAFQMRIPESMNRRSLLFLTKKC